jgi:hypothetical protein
MFIRAHQRDALRIRHASNVPIVCDHDVNLNRFVTELELIMSVHFIPTGNWLTKRVYRLLFSVSCYDRPALQYSER